MTEEQKQRLESVIYVHTKDEEDTFNKRIKSLGLENLTQYSTNKIWRQKRKQLMENIPYECFVCGKTSNLHLHHKTYKNIGNESHDDVCLLCMPCHVKAHKKIKRKAGEDGNSSRRLMDDYVWERIQFGARANGYKMRGRNNWQHYLLKLAEDSLIKLSEPL